MAKQIVIIGGGASGLTAAIFAARAGASVTLLERNERPGRKLLATGNGRCNLTNLNQSRLCYRGEDPDRAFQIISRFNVQRTIGFFSDLGLYTRNREGWIYPYTGQASSVLQLLLMEAAARKVKIKTRGNRKRDPPAGGWKLPHPYRGMAVSVPGCDYRLRKPGFRCGRSLRNRGKPGKKPGPQVSAFPACPGPPSLQGRLVFQMGGNKGAWNRFPVCGGRKI